MTSIDPFLLTTGGAGLIGLILGYAIKKLMKILAVVVGIFLAGILYLQSQGILNVNQSKLEHTASNVANNTIAQTNHILSNYNGGHDMFLHNMIIPVGAFGIAFAYGFMKG